MPGEPLARHSGNGKTLRLGSLTEQPLDRFCRNVALDQIPANLGGVTGRQFKGNAKAGPDAINRRCFNQKHSSSERKTCNAPDEVKISDDFLGTLGWPERRKNNCPICTNSGHQPNGYRAPRISPIEPVHLFTLSFTSCAALRSAGSS